ncbi:DUF1501 domain-containing protein [Schlesneria paludicola]|uniref:DUF1501 domain-containing protein n=1 Tax=Schlesneria paludicola TaxID=360056 RepID=UPI00029A736F|nr:DUF1501 domain-containing protein [Schlesneria paludicola]
MFPCQRYIAQPLTRREMLSQAAHGFGAVALSSMLGHQLASASTAPATNSLMPKDTHFPAKAKHIIFLYMDGGPSQVDSFDPKPVLDKYDGRAPHEVIGKVEPTQFANIGKILKSPWKFKQYGECGMPVSDLFPHIASCADDLAVVRSMISPFSEHTFANYFLHTGHGQQGRPSHGAWVSYGLGSECDDLPAFVILNGGLIPPGGMDCFGSGFLPAAFQGSVFTSGEAPVANIRPNEKTRDLQDAKLALMRRLDKQRLDQLGHVDALESAIANYELAARMQTAVPALMDLGRETKETQEAYGLFDEFPNTRTYGRSCLVARRLIERGVRFIELTCPAGNGDRWDQHSSLVDGHTKNARSVDKPVAALVKDLKQRGLLDQTLIVWCGEFGRTPFAQGSDGRDHNPFGFSIWLAGGGIKGGVIHGATDDFGYRAIENKVEVHDLHATMLHLLGVDHTRQTFRFGGRDMRLTDVHGHVVHEILT